MKNIKNIIHNKCTGCLNCVNVCPHKAISIKMDERGFNKPVIDEEKCTKCGLCLKKCHILAKENYIEPIVKTGYSKNNIYRNTCSSGGIFGLIADYFLSEGAIVYGAAYTKELMVEHIRISKREDLTAILGSKYIKSNLNNIFEDVKKDLDNNIKVLFSGTPCQIGALKKYLAKEYENLFLVDIICHGAPSPLAWKEFKKYINKKYASPIKSVNFRKKDSKWSTTKFQIELKNGKKITDEIEPDYMTAFLSNTILDNACYNCKYNYMNKLSDLSLGDFWGCQDEELKKRGISVIFINTPKGQYLLDSVDNNIEYVENPGLYYLIHNNHPIITPSAVNYSKDIYFEKIKNDYKKGIECCIDQNYSLKKDKNNVAILNFQYERYNFGANLVSYSLSKTLEKMGKTAYTINYNPFEKTDEVENYRTHNMYRFKHQYLKLTPEYKTKEELKILNNYFDTFIFGSDQIWKYGITKDNYEVYFGDFVDSNKKLISYAASFGEDELNITDEQKIKEKILLDRFSKISIREKSGQKICEKYYNLFSELVLDPTLLLDSKEYEKIIDDEIIDEPNGGYIATYFVQSESADIELLPLIEKKFPGKKIINAKGERRQTTFGNTFIYNSVAKWLSTIKNADYVITDSYHGLIFSLIFKKQFILITNNVMAKSRFDSLFSILDKNLEENKYRSLADVTEFKPINYKKIDKNLNEYRQKSIAFLKNALEEENVLKPGVYEFVKNLEVNNQLLENENKNYQENVNLLKQMLEEKTKESENLTADIHKLNGQLKDIYNSKSWRITGYARKLRQILRGIIKR